MNFSEVVLSDSVLQDLEEVTKEQTAFAKKNKAYIDQVADKPAEAEKLNSMRLALLSFAWQFAQESVLDPDEFGFSKIKTLKTTNMQRPMDLTIFGPESIDILEACERWFRSHKIIWRQLNIEFYADPSFYKNRLIDIGTWPLEDQKKFLVQAGIAFYRNQETRNYKKDISQNVSQKLPEEQLQCTRIGPCLFASNKTYLDDVFIAKTELENRLAIENTTPDEMQQRIVRKVHNQKITDIELFFAIADANFQRPLGQMLPSTLQCPKIYNADKERDIQLNTNVLQECIICPTSELSLQGAVLEHHGKSIGEHSKRKIVEAFRWALCFAQLTIQSHEAISNLACDYAEFLEILLEDDQTHMTNARKQAIIQALQHGPTEIVQQLGKNKE